MAEARTMIERWRLDYNHVRPHPAHGGLTPGAVRLTPPPRQSLRNLEGSAAQPLPPAMEIDCQPQRAPTMMEGPAGWQVTRYMLSANVYM